MELQQLRYFVSVARNGSFAEAADGQYVTRTALSKSVAKLEGELGYPLLERSHDGVRLTPAGERFFARASSIVDSCDMLEREAADERAVPCVSVCIPNSWVGFFTAGVDAFRASHTGIRVDVTSGPDSECLRRAQAGEFDVVVSQMPVPGATDDGVALAYAPLFVAMGEQHPLAGQDRVTREEMKAYDVLYYSCGYERVFWVPTIGARTERFDNDLLHIYSLLHQGEYLFPTPRFTIPDYQQGIVFRPYVGPYDVTTMFGFVVRRPGRAPELDQACEALRRSLVVE